ncbi:hypothetical protein PanWU01x14_238310 [Parasponia andersonii]|uniref:Uncharacterized protein n=1 Tax=Parasponia andersonii TaxID=3476 RepID=A0A2P5BHM3_PARAD|nr:hypothetical protein PanWU01x14_238310 [Parasponia andersonii]
MEIDLLAHVINIYDFDQALYNAISIEETMTLMVKILPYFLLVIPEIIDQTNLDLATLTRPQDFDLRKLSPKDMP